MWSFTNPIFTDGCKLDVANCDFQFASDDRFLIIDRSMLVHVGASLNHLDKRCFAFSSMDKSNILDILPKI